MRRDFRHRDARAFAHDRAHVDSNTRMRAEQISSMMTRHERMMSAMMDQMGGEMR